VKILLNDHKPIPTEIGNIETRGELGAVNIYGLKMKSVKLDQAELTKLSKPYDNDQMRRVMGDAVKGKYEKEK